MHYGAASKVQRAQSTEPTTLPPDPVRQRIIDTRRPQESEQQERFKFYPLSKGTGNERWRNDRKHALKDHISQMRNRVSIRTWLTPHCR